MASELAGEIGTHVPVQWKTIALDDDNDLVFDKALPRQTTFARIFIPDADGTMSITEGGGDIVTVPCVKGIPVIGIVKRFRTASTVGGIAGT